MEVFGSERFLSKQNLFGSHDANQFASHIVNFNFTLYRDQGDYFARSKASIPVLYTSKLMLWLN